MLRQWTVDKSLSLKKVGTDDMRSDILSKAVSPVEKFRDLASLILTGRKGSSELVPHGHAGASSSPGND